MDREALEKEVAELRGLLYLYLRQHNYQWWNTDSDDWEPFNEDKVYCECDKCGRVRELLER